jgi:hypothetical protein
LIVIPALVGEHFDRLSTGLSNQSRYPVAGISLKIWMAGYYAELTLLAAA